MMLAHQIERGADQQLELLVGLVGVGEEAGQEVQKDLVRDRGDLRDAMGLGVRDHRDRSREVERLPREGRHDRARRLECRIGGAQRVVLIPDREEAAVVGVLPMAASALALLDDLAHGPQRGVEIGDCDDLRPPEQLRRRLRAWRADEQRSLAKVVRQPRQPVLDPSVEMSDGEELLPARHRL